MKNLYNVICMAISMFTVIPLPKYEWDESLAKHIMKIYPLIGVIVGCFWYFSFIILNKLQVSLVLTSSIILAVPFLLTGFLHLDGFMDVCDALLSRRSKEEKLRILKDSTVGAFSVISLVILLIIEFSAVLTVLDKGIDMKVLIFIPIVSRNLAAYFIITCEMIGESSLGRLFKNGTGLIDKYILIAFYMTILFISYISFGIVVLSVLIIMSFGAFTIILRTKKELGGINGDVAGYILVISECIGLITLAII